MKALLSVDFLQESTYSVTCILLLRFKESDAFIGFQSQTPATVVLQASQLLDGSLHSWDVDVSG